VAHLAKAEALGRAHHHLNPGLIMSIAKMNVLIPNTAIQLKMTLLITLNMLEDF